MRSEKDEFEVSFKVLQIFSTMRVNLAIVDAFSRGSFIGPENKDEVDLGFLGIKPGEDQHKIHNQSIVTIVVALLYQTLANYYVMKSIKAELKDPDVEEFLNGLEDPDKKFIEGMRIIRNGMFHVRVAKGRERKCATFFTETCNKRGGVVQVMYEMQKILYGFTEKCFSGKLKIWPTFIYDIDITDFEQKIGIQLPEDLAEMLTQQ